MIEKDRDKLQKKIKPEKIKKHPDKNFHASNDTLYEIPEEKNNTEQTVEEPEAIMQYKTHVNNVMQKRRVLKESADKPESQMTPFEKIGMIRKGISKKDLENLKEKAGLDYNQLSKVLSVARATLINKKGNDKFAIGISEKIVGVADIYSYGYEVFEDEGRFNNWIFRSNQSLGGLSPYDLLDNQYGRDEVKSLIGRIDYGVYS
ncbi:MAG: antitoxin Xre/MbcA/ParS toxin-binding domain-containing protein [Segetibacter sp.]